MTNITEVDLGLVVGANGLSPQIEIIEDTITNYTLRITWFNEFRQPQTFITPNLRGTTTRLFQIGIQFPNVPRILALSDLGLDAARHWALHCFPAVEFPRFRSVVAKRIENAIHIFLYYDTNPYTTPQLGSPLGNTMFRIGQTDLRIGNFRIGQRFSYIDFPIMLIATESGSRLTPIPVF